MLNSVDESTETDQTWAEKIESNLVDKVLEADQTILPLRL